MLINKVGILTWHYYQNFGSALQCFALQTILENLGLKVKVINYRNPMFGAVNMTKEYLCSALAPILQHFSRRLNLANLIFRKKYIHETHLVKTSEEIWDLSKHFDVVVFGSDQIWAPNLFNPVYLGESIGNDVRKVSYAASIGLNDIPDNLLPKYKQLLSDFHAVSIREFEGKVLLQTKCGLDSKVVLDPTLMIDVNIYLKMQRKVKEVQEPYIFCYFLNKEHRYRQTVENYAQKYNLRIVGVSDKVDDGEWMNRLTGLGADHFLWLINHADTIITDSYHGAIFSLLFHKNLWIFQRFAEDNPICQNSRIRQLQTNFNIEHRVISANAQIYDIAPIDYGYVDSQLSALRFTSLDFLKNALR